MHIWRAQKIKICLSFRILNNHPGWSRRSKYVDEVHRRYWLGRFVKVTIVINLSYKKNVISFLEAWIVCGWSNSLFNLTRLNSFQILKIFHYFLKANCLQMVKNLVSLFSNFGRLNCLLIVKSLFVTRLNSLIVKKFT